MGFNVNACILVLLSANLVLSKTILLQSSKENVEEVATVIKDYKESTSKPVPLDTPIPGRVSCVHEEPTEDEVCQELCIPKGYLHGLCISKTCSCI